MRPAGRPVRRPSRVGSPLARVRPSRRRQSCRAQRVGGSNPSVHDIPSHCHVVHVSEAPRPGLAEWGRQRRSVRCISSQTDPRRLIRPGPSVASTDPLQHPPWLVERQIEPFQAGSCRSVETASSHRLKHTHSPPRTEPRSPGNHLNHCMVSNSGTCSRSSIRWPI